MAQPNTKIAAPAAPAVHGAKAPRKTVTVASKLPMHLEIQLCQEKTASVTGQFGSVKETVNVKFGAIYVIRGTGHPAGTVPKGFPKAPELNKPGFALTHGVDAEFFARWLEQNKDTEMVINGLIMAHGDEDSLEDMTKERRKVDSGLGPLNPDGDPRSPKPLSTAVSPVKPETESMAA